MAADSKDRGVKLQSGKLSIHLVYDKLNIQVAIIATSNTPLNIIIQYIYTIQTFSALHFALIRIYTQIFTALKLSLNENTKNIK